MRVENGAIGGAASDLYTRPSGGSTQNIRSSSSTLAAGADRSELSDTGAWVGLAKTVASPEYLNRVQSLGADIQAGRYQADPAAVSQALLDEHLYGK